MGWIVVGLVLFLGGPLLIYFRLAPQNQWFTLIKEGTAKIIVRGGAFVNISMQWKDRIFRGKGGGIIGDDEWEVIEGKEFWKFGGLRFYSPFYPLDEIYTYRHRWTHLHENGEIVTHDERLDFVFLKEDLYVIEIPLKDEGGAEDLNGVPLGIKIVLPMKIINPYIAVFRVRRWLPMITGIIQARLRQFIANYRYKEDLLNMRAGKGIKDAQARFGVPGSDQTNEGKDLYEKFWEEVEENFKAEGGKIEDQKEKRVIKIYGVEISEKGARILEIDPSSRYREFTTMEYEASQKKRRTEIEAEARAVETIGTTIQMMAVSRGKTVAEITREIDSDPQAQKEFLEMSKDIVVRKIGIEGNAYLDIRVVGNGGQAVGGLEGIILNALAAWKRMPGGRTEKRVVDKPSRGTRELPPELTKEEEKEIEEWLKEDEEDEESI